MLGLASGSFAKIYWQTFPGFGTIEKFSIFADVQNHY
jgi:hypothetical protein